MISILFKTAIRSFKRKPLIPSINLIGLSIGIACFITISLYLYQEHNYEAAFTDAERIYRVEENFLSMGALAWTSPNMPFALADIPLIQEHTRIGSYGGDFKVKTDGQSIKLDQVLLADSSFFKIFDYEFAVGNPLEALQGPNQAVISETTAILLFGSTDVLGKQLVTDEFGTLQINGVIKKSELKSHLDFELILYREWQEYGTRKWFGVGGYSYVELVAGTGQDELDKALMSMTEQEVFPVVYKKGLESDNPMSFEEWVSSPNAIAFKSKSIKDIHLNSQLQFELGPNGDRQTRVTLSIIGVFTLIIAMINFMNLSTAQASKKAKEVGVKKVLGAGRGRLVRQFLLQSVLTTLIAAILGGGLAELFVRLINLQLGEMITVSLLAQFDLMIGILFAMILLGLMAGTYPAFYLSGVKSLPLLKGKSFNEVLSVKSALGIRNGLVVFQFLISASLIAASVVVFQQMKHLQQLSLGFDDAQVLVIDNAYELGANKDVFRDRIMQLPSVEKASYTMRVPSDGSDATLSTMLDAETTLTFGQFIADEHLAETIGFELLAGEWFNSLEEKNDSVVIVNESAIQALGIEDPVGKVFGNYYRIKAVVKDFKYGGLRQEIGPALIFNAGKAYSRLAIRLQPGIKQLEELEELWYDYAQEPIEASFLNEKYLALLENEKQVTNGVLLFTILAILIAALGLFGLATFSVEQRKQEFGIRRVLGASFKELVSLFSLHFIKLILIAFFCSIPLSYYGLQEWLAGFADRIEIGWVVFILTAVFVFSVAALTLLSQSLQISSVNPVETLREE